MQLFTLLTILITYTTYNTYVTCIAYNTMRLLTLLTILILTLLTMFTTKLDYLPNLQFLHNKIKLTYSTLKEKKDKGLAYSCPVLILKFELKKLYMVYTRLLSFPSLSFSFSGDLLKYQVFKRLQKSQQRRPLF